MLNTTKSSLRPLHLYLKFFPTFIHSRFKLPLSVCQFFLSTGWLSSLKLCRPPGYHYKNIHKLTERVSWTSAGFTSLEILPHPVVFLLPWRRPSGQLVESVISQRQFVRTTPPCSLHPCIPLTHFSHTSHTLLTVLFPHKHLKFRFVALVAALR